MKSRRGIAVTGRKFKEYFTLSAVGGHTTMANNMAAFISRGTYVD